MRNKYEKIKDIVMEERAVCFYVARSGKSLVIGETKTIGEVIRMLEREWTIYGDIKDAREALKEMSKKNSK